MSNTLDRVGFAAQIIICLSVLATFFGTIYVLLTGQQDLSTGTREVLLVLVGVLAGSYKDIIGYYFGSSLGSAKKTEAMAKDDTDQAGA